jgi:hypothetical protein
MSFIPRPVRFGLLLGVVALLGSALAAPQRAAPAFAAPRVPLSSKLSDYEVTKLDDFETTMKATFHDDRAARKIDRDAGLIYQLKSNVHIRYKEENKFRADGTIGANRASMVINDNKQSVRLSLGIKKSEDLGNSPGKRKSLLDMGLISEYYLTYAQGEFLGEKTFEGVPCAVFKITFKDRSLDTSHRIVWIDPKTRITLKREEYLQETLGGKLRDVWLYRDPQEVAPGLYFPTRIELYNNENQKAGETAYTKTHVNIGLSDSLFHL